MRPTGVARSGSSPVVGWLRRHRVVVGVATAVLAVLVVLSMLTAHGSTRGGALDPDNPSAGGAQALARVLAGQGVPVSVVRRAADLDRAGVDARTTLVVTSSQHLGRGSAGRLARQAARAGAVVLPDPAGVLVRALRLPVAADGRSFAGRGRAGCADPLLSGLELAVPASPTFSARQVGGAVDGTAVQVTRCFSEPEPEAGQEPGSWVVRVDRPAPTYVVGASGLFTNERVDRADNAAAALRLFGQRQRLVWYVPDVRDVAVGDTGSLSAQLPDGLLPALWLAASALLTTMLWRGRRLGPLVVEPLPVVVKAVESTEGRGRLYRRVRDRSHAAAVLREAAVRRLSGRLRLPVGTGAEPLVGAVADATGTPPTTVRELLVTRPVTDDAALTRLAADLSALEKEVHTP